MLAVLSCSSHIRKISTALLVAATVFPLSTTDIIAKDEQPAKSLPKLSAAANDVTVSGISSGAYMAGQFQLAHAKKVSGAAIIAGGPYGCALSSFSAFTFGIGREMVNLSKAVNGCMLNLYAVWGEPDVERMINQAKDRARADQIDPISSVLPDKVYLFSGREDHTVVPAIVKSAYDFYLKLGVPEKNIKRVMQYSAGHGFVTENNGGSCELSAQPFVVDCDYDQAGDLLAFFYGDLKSPSAELAGEYVTFDQRPFVEGLKDADMADQGIAYIPQNCTTSPDCRVHIAFHGCGQNAKFVGNAFVKGSGFARWADTNRLIVLFPQVRESLGSTQACWDWWGYTGDNFLIRDGVQITAVNRMLEHLSKVP